MKILVKNLKKNTQYLYKVDKRKGYQHYLGRTVLVNGSWILLTWNGQEFIDETGKIFPVRERYIGKTVQSNDIKILRYIKNIAEY